jgi:hypothetical protein
MHASDAADGDLFGSSVVDFYNNWFNIGLTAQDHADLVAFLRML